MTRLLIVHYAGDYREADRLRREEGKEIYYGHGYVLDQLARLRAQGHEVGFLCCLAPAYWTQLSDGVTVIGADANPDKDPATVLRLMERYDPTHLIINGPMMPLIRWGLSRRKPLGVVLADSFANLYYRYVRFRRLPALLNQPGISLIANHGYNAARALVDFGVDADKVVPWDFPHVRTPDLYPAKTAPSGPVFELLYVGSISAKKGVGDLLRAVARLSPQLGVRLTIAGVGAVARFERQAARLGIADRVTFLGLVPNGDIPDLMHRADAVIVPSRHTFPEGLPLTLYEALASRTPVIASDHPMFEGHLVHGESAMIFPASRPRALAKAVADLMTDPDLYARISNGAPLAWDRMQNPVKWGEMLERWVRGSNEDVAWLSVHSIARTAEARGEGL